MSCVDGPGGGPMNHVLWWRKATGHPVATCDDVKKQRLRRSGQVGRKRWKAT
jgi:hypothetical protein